MTDVRVGMNKSTLIKAELDPNPLRMFARLRSLSLVHPRTQQAVASSSGMPSRRPVSCKILIFLKSHQNCQKAFMNLMENAYKNITKEAGKNKCLTNQQATGPKFIIHTTPPPLPEHTGYPLRSSQSPATDNHSF